MCRLGVTNTQEIFLLLTDFCICLLVVLNRGQPGLDSLLLVFVVPDDHLVLVLEGLNNSRRILHEIIIFVFFVFLDLVWIVWLWPNFLVDGAAEELDHLFLPVAARNPPEHGLRLVIVDLVAEVLIDQAQRSLLHDFIAPELVTTEADTAAGHERVKTDRPNYRPLGNDWHWISKPSENVAIDAKLRFNLNEVATIQDLNGELLAAG